MHFEQAVRILLKGGNPLAHWKLTREQVCRGLADLELAMTRASRGDERPLILQPGAH